MRQHQRVTIPWPWLVAAVAGGLIASWGVDEIAGSSWWSIAAFTLGTLPVLVTFALTRPRK
jgi:hypothetical protein